MHNLWITPSWTQANLWTNTLNIIWMNCFKIRADKILDFSLLAIKTRTTQCSHQFPLALRSLHLAFEGITDIHSTDS